MWKMATEAGSGLPYANLPGSLTRILLNVTDVPQAASSLNDETTASSMRVHLNALVEAGLLRQTGTEKYPRYSSTPAGLDFVAYLRRYHLAFQEGYRAKS